MARPVFLRNVGQRNKGKTLFLLHPEGLPQIMNQMNTHDFCGTDLVAGLLLGTLQRSGEKKILTNQRTAFGCRHYSTSQLIWHSDVSMTKHHLLIIFFYYGKSEVYCFWWILPDTQFCMSYNVTRRIKIPLLPLYPEVTCCGSCKTQR